MVPFSDTQHTHPGICILESPPPLPPWLEPLHAWRLTVKVIRRFRGGAKECTETMLISFVSRSGKLKEDSFQDKQLYMLDPSGWMTAVIHEHNGIMR